MPDKTYRTAIVVIPPEEAWVPIQAIRQTRDRNYRRWMPHITMVYPFVPMRQFEPVIDELAESCRAVRPFDITLAEFRAFRHRGGRSTVYLAPEPTGALIALHGALLNCFPDCDDTAGFKRGFTPHLSVGQSVGRQETRELVDTLNSSWRELSFGVSQISLIWRNDYPDDTFRIAHQVALGT